MKKNVFGRKLKRDSNERKALFKNLLTSLVLEERIKTSIAKAKAIKSAADKLITKAKKGGTVAYRALEAEVNHDAVVKLIDDLAPRFAQRAGGYTRIIKVGNRVSDNSPEAIIEWVERASANSEPKTVNKEQKGKQAKSREQSTKSDKKETKVEATAKVEKKKEVKKETKKKVEKKK